MKKNLPIYQNIKPPSIIPISVSIIILTLSTSSATQGATQSGITLSGSNTLAGSSLAVGEIVWVVITLVFSFGLNMFLRRNEKKPEKIIISEPDQLIQQPLIAAVKQKTEIIKSIRIKRTNKLAHKFAYQRERVLQPFNAVQYLTVSHKNTEVTTPIFANSI